MGVKNPLTPLYFQRAITKPSVEQQVQGQKVLVPVVYLAQGETSGQETSGQGRCFLVGGWSYYFRGEICAKESKNSK